jgi:hypothetical protein
VHLRRIEPKDWVEISKWCEIEGHGPLTKEITGEYGFVVEDGDRLLSCGWLLAITGTNLCLMEYFKTNPEALKFTQAKALMFLAQGMRELAILSGFSGIIGIVDEGKKALQRYYQREGGQPRAAQVFIFKL